MSEFFHAFGNIICSREFSGAVGLMVGFITVTTCEDIKKAPLSTICYSSLYGSLYNVAAYSVAELVPTMIVPIIPIALIGNVILNKYPSI